MSDFLTDDTVLLVTLNRANKGSREAAEDAANTMPHLPQWPVAKHLCGERPAVAKSDTRATPRSLNTPPSLIPEASVAPSSPPLEAGRAAARPCAAVAKQVSPPASSPAPPDCLAMSGVFPRLDGNVLPLVREAVSGCAAFCERRLTCEGGVEIVAFDYSEAGLGAERLFPDPYGESHTCRRP